MNRLHPTSSCRYATQREQWTRVRACPENTDWSLAAHTHAISQGLSFAQTRLQPDSILHSFSAPCGEQEVGYRYAHFLVILSGSTTRTTWRFAYDSFSSHRVDEDLLQFASSLVTNSWSTKSAVIMERHSLGPQTTGCLLFHMNR